MTHSNQTILVVEDSEDDYEVLQRAFKKNEITNPLVHCITGDQALDYLYQRNTYQDVQTVSRPCLILLDLNLPGTDGRQVLEKIKQENHLKVIPVIVFTTSSDERDIQECYQAGANAYINKPMDFNRFIETFKHFKNFWFDTSLLPKKEE